MFPTFLPPLISDLYLLLGLPFLCPFVYRSPSSPFSLYRPSIYSTSNYQSCASVLHPHFSTLACRSNHQSSCEQSGCITSRKMTMTTQSHRALDRQPYHHPFEVNTSLLGTRRKVRRPSVRLRVDRPAASRHVHLLFKPHGAQVKQD